MSTESIDPSDRWAAFEDQRLGNELYMANLEAENAAAEADDEDAQLAATIELTDLQEYTALGG